MTNIPPLRGRIVPVDATLAHRTHVSVPAAKVTVRAAFVSGRSGPEPSSKSTKFWRAQKLDTSSDLDLCHALELSIASPAGFAQRCGESSFPTSLSLPNSSIPRRIRLPSKFEFFLALALSPLT